MKVIIRKILYAIFCFILIDVATSGFYGETHTLFAVQTACLCIVMMPAKWDRDFINWKKIFGKSEEKDKE